MTSILTHVRIESGSSRAWTVIVNRTDMDLKNQQEQTVHLNQNEKEQEVPRAKQPWWTKVTLEPMWFGVFISLTMCITGFKNMAIQRACLVDLNYTAEVCFSEGLNKSIIEREAQQIVSRISVGSSLVSGTSSGLVLLFLGPWSDTSGRRRPLMMLSITGMMVTSLVLVILQFLPNVGALVVVYAETIAMSCTGGVIMLMIAGFSHLGDICYSTGRCHTTVMGINSGFMSLFMVIGSCSGGLIYRWIGFTGMFGIGLVLEFTSFLYVLLKVKDVYSDKEIPNVLDIRLPLAAVKCVFKKREGSRRKNILLMVAVTSFNSIVMTTEYSIGYMYLRNRFSWTEIEYSTFLTVKSIIHVFGTSFIIKLLKHKMQLRDETIGLLGGISQLGASAMFMFSSQGWMIMASNIFGLLSRGVMIAERPVLNKQITAREQGKVNSISIVIEKCIAVLTTPLANFIYSETLDIFPSTFMSINCAAAVVQLLCYNFVVREPEEKELEKIKEVPDVKA